jgi:hypothetical protein
LNNHFAGPITVLTGISNGSRVIVVGVITNGMLRGQVNFYTGQKAITDGASFTWTSRSMGGAIFATGHNLASTKDSSETFWSFFVSRTDGTVELLRLLNGGASTINIGQPDVLNGVQGCQSMAAAQGPLDSTNYALNLWCTASNVSQSKIYVAWATSAASLTFSWTSHALGGLAQNSTYTVAADARTYATSFTALDGFVATQDNHIWLDSRNKDGWPSNAVDLGTSNETSSNTSGLVSMQGTQLSTGFFSRVFWIGMLTGQPGTSAKYLYGRVAQGSPGDLSWYRGYGAGDPRHRADGLGTTTHTESMISDYQGYSVAVSIVRPNTGNPQLDYAYTQAMWSNDDGVTWSAPSSLPKVVNGLSYSYLSDPTVAISSSKTAYIGVLAADYTGVCLDMTASDRQAIYLTSTMASNPSVFSTPVLVAGGTGAPGEYVDHDWVGIDRNTTPNRLHITWAGGGEVIGYRCMDEGATCPGASTPCCQAGCNTPPCLGPVRDLAAPWGQGLGPPVLTVGGDHSVYVAWYHYPPGLLVCRLTPFLDNCDDTPFSLAGNLAPKNANLLIPGTSGYLIDEQTYSFAAAQENFCPASCPTCGILYYAFSGAEPGHATKDVYFSRGTYCPTSPSGQRWTWTAPVVIPTAANDGTDQFSPAVTTLSDGVAGVGLSAFDPTVVVGWYDRRETCSVTGFTNRCLRLRAAISGNGGLSWLDEHAVQNGTLTDPWLLPYHCQDPASRRFIGDYHEHESGLLHAHHLWSSAPETGGTNTGQLWQAFTAWGDHAY